LRKKRKLPLAITASVFGALALCCFCTLIATLSTPKTTPQSTVVPQREVITVISQPIQTYTPKPHFTQTLEPTVVLFTPTFISTLYPTSTITILAFSLPGFPCVPSTTQRDKGFVTYIVDGNTIGVTINGQSFRVRYIGIDTPERNEYLYYEATAANRALVYGRNVILVKDVSETDRYGRLLRYVFVDSVFVNHELVKQGYALASTYPPDVACSALFANTQGQAQSSQVGLWKQAPSPATIVGSSDSGGTSGNCDPSYPTVCIPPPPPDLDCKDIPYQDFQVLPPDPHHFDGDHDGVGCES